MLWQQLVGGSGFDEAKPSGDPFAIPLTSQWPQDEVPDPLGMLQQALRSGDMSITVREVVESENAYGGVVTTVFMQTAVGRRSRRRTHSTGQPARLHHRRAVRQDQRRSLAF